MILLTFLGPEYRGRAMTARQDTDLVEAAGLSTVVRAMDNAAHPTESSDGGEVADVEKGTSYNAQQI